MFSKRGNSKAQSAMEYLMTYGWAILIISIVLAALFALGIFSSSSFIGTTCVASAGYECSTPIVHAGAFNAILGQSTGVNWLTTNIVFITGGGTPATLSAGAAACTSTFPSGLNNGQYYTAGFTAAASAPASGAITTCPTSFSSTVGTTYTGALWVEYTETGVSGFLWTEIATVTLKST